jgi:hypothetical protein
MSADRQKATWSSAHSGKGAILERERKARGIVLTIIAAHPAEFERDGRRDSKQGGKPMHSSMYGKIAKAKQYSQEPDRLQFTRFEASFRGENDSHIVKLDETGWHCTCNFFADWSTCAHTMAAERLLGQFIPSEMRQGEPLAVHLSSSVARP